jgi:myo-inositol-1(or 4)-monophosphatase
MAVRSAVLNVMFKAAEKAAKGLVRDFGELENLQVSVKGIGDFVSAADLRAEKILKQELTKARPGWGFLMEESGSQDGDGVHRWIVDPLDGTTNFLHGIPQFAISIALEVDGEITAGVVYNPVTDERFWAEKGDGAYFNNRRMRVSARRKMDEAVIATGIPHKGRAHHETFLRQLPRIMASTAGVRRMGAAALDLAFTAAGRFDGFWEMGLSPWDCAAGVLLVREAGGYVSALDGRDKNPILTGNLLVSNEPLHYALLKLLRADDAAAPEGSSDAS